MIEVEIFSRDWWRRDPDEVLRIIPERDRTVVCGRAAPGRLARRAAQPRELRADRPEGPPHFFDRSNIKRGMR